MAEHKSLEYGSYRELSEKYENLREKHDSMKNEIRNITNKISSITENFPLSRSEIATSLELLEEYKIEIEDYKYILSEKILLSQIVSMYYNLYSTIVSYHDIKLKDIENIYTILYEDLMKNYNVRSKQFKSIAEHINFLKLETLELQAIQRLRFRKKLSDIDNKVEDRLQEETQQIPILKTMHDRLNTIKCRKQIGELIKLFKYLKENRLISWNSNTSTEEIVKMHFKFDADLELIPIQDFCPLIWQSQSTLLIYLFNCLIDRKYIDNLNDDIKYKNIIYHFLDSESKKFNRKSLHNTYLNYRKNKNRKPRKYEIIDLFFNDEYEMK